MKIVRGMKKAKEVLSRPQGLGLQLPPGIQRRIAGALGPALPVGIGLSVSDEIQFHYFQKAAVLPSNRY